MTTLLQDLKYAFRLMMKTPGFTFVAVLSIALGIGANSAIFSVVNAVLLRPLAYGDSDRLAVILHSGRNPVSPANFLDWQKSSKSFEQMGAAEYWTPNISRAEGTEKIYALHVTSEILPLLRVQPVLGRVFTASEQTDGNDHEVVISYSLWQSDFGGSRSALNESVTLNGEKYRIIGVMPRGFQFAPFWATKAQLWAPLVLTGKATDRGANSLRIFGRLRSGTTLEQAQAEITTITANLEREFPGTNAEVKVVSLKEKVVGNVRPALLVLLAAVGAVLLIACANVAHMLLARSSARQKEVALRTALGAGRVRVLRQFLTESLLLAIFGGVVGLLLAQVGVRLLIALSPGNIPRLDTVTLDTNVLLFVVALTFIAGLVFGIAPALRASELNPSEALKEGGRSGSESIGRNRLRSLLIASEFTFALVLLVAAGLMIRSFIALQSIDPGFQPHHVLSLIVSAAGSEENASGKRVLFFQQVIERTRQLPGVESASAINHLPLGGDLWGRSYYVEGRPVPAPNDMRSAIYRVVMPGYFRTMDIPIVRGRDVAESDTAQAPRVVVVSQRFAERQWPGEDPIGKRFTLGRPPDPPQWMSVIGVVKNAVQEEWAGRPQEEIYLPYLQTTEYLGDASNRYSYLTLVVRTQADPASAAPAVQQLIRSMDKNVAISDLQTMDQLVADAKAEPQFYMVLLGTFSAVALILSAIGIYGVMSYSVTRRTQEIGIRIALGAQARDVIAMIVGQGAALALGGVGIGLISAFAVARLMSRLLYGVVPGDPLTFISVAVLLTSVALIACYIPARRAAQVDPMFALRRD